MARKPTRTDVRNAYRILEDSGRYAEAIRRDGDKVLPWLTGAPDARLRIERAYETLHRAGAPPMMPEGLKPYHAWMIGSGWRVPA